MTPTQWSVISVIGTLIIGAITLYFLARSNARDNRRQQEEAIRQRVREAVDEAVSPLRLQVEDRDRTIADRDRNIQELQRQRERFLARIDALEDELRRGRAT